MSRFLPAAIAIATLALPGARAEADDCMCLGPETLFLADGIGSSAGALDEEPVLESPDDTIETVDPTVPSPTVAEAPSPARGPVAWCRSADDPRCQRDGNREAPYRITLGHAPVATLLITPRVPPAAVESVRFPRTDERGPGGVAFRLDRPPRA